jgi:rhodanese-related sulfurtransferase
MVAAMLMQTPALADEVTEAIVGYMDFATYEAGIIQPAQITPDILPSVLFVDTRSADQFAAGAIDGAVNIDWREIPARLDELPGEGLVVLYCNTGTLSAQATFAARVLGRENVVVLQGGIDAWKTER